MSTKSGILYTYVSCIHISGFFLANFRSDLNFFSANLSSIDAFEGFVDIRFALGTKAFSSFNFNFSIAFSLLSNCDLDFCELIAIVP